jgi:hypothetical protein
MEVPAIRSKILEFLCFEEDQELEAVYEEEFFVEARVMKGEILKTLIGGEYVTQYSFKIVGRGREVEIVKRFSEIEDFHNVISDQCRN